MRLRKINPTKIPALLANGLSAAEIAEEFGCSEGSLRVRCSQLKISLRRASVQVVHKGSKTSPASPRDTVQPLVRPPAGVRAKRPSKIDPKQIPLLLDRGFTSAEIAAEFGCTLGTLRVRCSRLQISLRQPRKASSQTSADSRRPASEIASHNGAVPARALVSSKAHLIAGNGSIDIALPVSTIGELRQRAAAMGLSAAALAASLLETISRDSLYNAVLDAD
jgi:hypothetical protein